MVTSATLRGWSLPDIGDNDGKRARGSVLVLGGAADTPGAVLLAGVAALRAGAGRLTIATAHPTAAALAVAVPEAAVVGLPTTAGGALAGEAAGAVAELAADADAVVLGPGMREAAASRQLVAGVLARLPTGTAVVLDAMGLTCGAVCAATVAGRPAVATPNSTEAAYLLGSELDVAPAAAELAGRLDSVVALRSHVAAPDGRRWVDGGGNSGLGTSGSGDVLAGVVGGLLARGAQPAQAAVWGVHLHAEAGERLAARIGRLGYLARELLDELPLVLAQLEG